LAKLKISGKPIICYDQANGMWASRAAFVFRCWGYGHTVSYLIGGLQAWPGATEQGTSNFGESQETTIDAQWQD